jgi:hypothetical protein
MSAGATSRRIARGRHRVLGLHTTDERQCRPPPPPWPPRRRRARLPRRRNRGKGRAGHDHEGCLCTNYFSSQLRISTVRTRSNGHIYAHSGRRPPPVVVSFYRPAPARLLLRRICWESRVPLAKMSAPPPPAFNRQFLCWLWPWMVMARKVACTVSVKDFTNDQDSKYCFTYYKETSATYLL